MKNSSEEGFYGKPLSEVQENIKSMTIPMNKCCELIKMGQNLHDIDCNSHEKEETTTSQAILLDIYEREGLVGIEKHIAKERTLAKKEVIDELLKKAVWINSRGKINVVTVKDVRALLPEQESK